MRVLLIQAPLGRNQAPVVPYGLAWVAAGLGPDHDVRILDPNVSSPAHVDAQIRTFRPQVVGLSLRNVDTTHAGDPYAFFGHFPPFVRRIRSRVGPDVPLVAGGSGFSLFAPAVLRRVPEIDLGIHMDGTESFAELLEDLDRPHRVAGLYLREAGEPRFTGPRPPASLARYRPRLDLVDLSAYRPHAVHYAFGVLTRRGCSGRCAYCTYHLLEGSAVQNRSPQQVAEEVSWLHDTHGVDRFMTTDSVFNQDPEHANAVIEALARAGTGARWRAYHTVAGLDRAYLQRAVRAGLREITFSPDAIAPGTLRYLAKGVEPEQIWHSLALVAETPPLVASWNFFVGLPGQDLRELTALQRFHFRARRQLGPRLRGFRLNHVRVEPGTALHRRMVRQGYLPEADDLLPESADQMRPLFLKTSGHRLLDALIRSGLLHRRPFCQDPHHRTHHRDERASPADRPRAPTGVAPPPSGCALDAAATGTPPTDSERSAPAR